jgi:hypothetical protein
MRGQEWGRRGAEAEASGAAADRAGECLWGGLSGKFRGAFDRR